MLEPFTITNHLIQLSESSYLRKLPSTPSTNITGLMNRISTSFFAALLTVGAIACNNTNTTEPVAEEAGTELPSTGNFGKTINEEGLIQLASLDSIVVPGQEFDAKIEGEIVEVCQKKGCWMTIRKDDGSVMRVTFKDYGFFVPKDAAGKRAVMEGVAYYDTLTVAVLKHYAEDAGKTAEEIEKITEPESAMAFEATGVIIK